LFLSQNPGLARDEGQASNLQNLRGEMVQLSREFGTGFSTNCELEDWGGTRGLSVEKERE
jgi:hypothetical protein